MTTSKFLVYCLTDPRTGTAMYVGKSCSGLNRPRQHKWPSHRRTRTPKNSWVKSLLSDDLTYGIDVLEELSSGEEAADAERFWIAAFRATGATLLNIEDGGLGALGVHPSIETRAKISLSKVGNQHALGHRRSDEDRISKSVAQGGRPFVDETGRKWNTLAEAAAFWKLDRRNVSSVLNGWHKTCGGHSFRYQEGAIDGG